LKNQLKIGNALFEGDDMIAFFSTLDGPTGKLPGWAVVEDWSFVNWEAWLSKSAAMEWWKASNA